MQAMNLPHSAAAVVVCTSIKAFYSRFLIERQTRAFISRNSTSLSDLTEENLQWKSRKVFIQSYIREKNLHAPRQATLENVCVISSTNPGGFPSIKCNENKNVFGSTVVFIALCMDDEVRKSIFRKLTNRPRTIFFFFCRYIQTSDRLKRFCQSLH